MMCVYYLNTQEEKIVVSMKNDMSSASHKQPSCITVLFLTEMWERFGFYIVQVLLIFYLTNVFHFSDILSAAIMGAFTAISYITPVAGGFLANRFLGYKHSVVLGGILLSIGYALMGLQQGDLFYLALSIIAVGTGFFKPSISTYLGNFYNENDSRCERGYTIFYIGINVGIVLATTLSGYILKYFGWHANFIVASVGLLIAVLTFIIGLYQLESKGQLQMVREIEYPSLTVFSGTIIYLGTVFFIYLFSIIIKNTELANIIFMLGALAMVMTLVIISFRSGTEYQGKMLACLLLIALSTLFWALYYQLFFALNLFVERVLDRAVMGHILPSPIFISLLPIFIILLGPVIGWIWQALDRNNINPSSAIKFSMSLFAMALGLFFLVIGTTLTNTLGLVNPQWVVFAYLFFTLGELLLSPICIAMVINMAPPKYAGIMMGAYLAAIGFGAKLAGGIAGMAAIPSSMQETSQIVSVYHHAFIVYTEIAAVSGLVILALAPLISRLTHRGQQQITMQQRLEIAEDPSSS